MRCFVFYARQDLLHVAHNFVHKLLAPCCQFASGTFYRVSIQRSSCTCHLPRIQSASLGIDASTCSSINSFTRGFLSGYGFACPFTLSLNLKLRPLRMQMECWRSYLSASFGGSADSFQLFGRSQCNARKQLVPGIKTLRGSANVGQRRVL